MGTCLTDREIDKLRTASHSLHTVSNDRIKSDLTRKDITERLRGQSVIDLGSGTGWYLPLFFDAGCKELMVVEPKPKEELLDKIKEMGSQGLKIYLETDAYKFWDKQPDESSIVTSYGVFDHNIVGGCRSILIDDSDLDVIIDGFYRNTTRQIERITPTGQITIHRGPSANLIRRYSQRLQPYSGDGIHTDWKETDGGILVKQ